MGYVVAIPLIVGAFFTFMNRNRLHSLYVIEWIFLGALINGAFTTGPSHSQRLIILLLAALLIVLNFFNKIVNILSSRKIIGYFIIVLISFFIIGEELFFYFADYTPNRKYAGDAYGQMFTYTGRYLSLLPLDQYVIYFLKEENVYDEAIPSLKFLTKYDGFNISDMAELKNIDSPKSIIVIGDMLREKETKRLSDYLRGVYVPLKNNKDEQIAWVFISPHK